jgi:hypothetical protein
MRRLQLLGNMHIMDETKVAERSCGLDRRQKVGSVEGCEYGRCNKGD